MLGMQDVEKRDDGAESLDGSDKGPDRSRQFSDRLGEAIREEMRGERKKGGIRIASVKIWVGES